MKKKIIDFVLNVITKDTFVINYLIVINIVFAIIVIFYVFIK